MIKAVKKDTGSVFYMRVQKHKCPLCGGDLKVVKMKKVVRSKSGEASSFNFNACDKPLGEKVKFIWYEFKCCDCKTHFTEKQIRAVEKAIKKLRKEARRRAKKAQSAEIVIEKKVPKTENIDHKPADVKPVDTQRSANDLDSQRPPEQKPFKQYIVIKRVQGDNEDEQKVVVKKVSVPNDSAIKADIKE